ncbi:hypothetical protein [Mesorhizobium intechi]|nr:hypothetical protein [Mesorhizobium intechi]
MKSIAARHGSIYPASGIGWNVPSETTMASNLPAIALVSNLEG